MSDEEKKEFAHKVEESIDLKNLIDEIKVQETKIIAFDIDNLTDEEKEVIKAYRRNLRTLYTKYSKEERELAGDIDEDFFKPSPTNEEEDKKQREKQSAFDKLMHLKEEFYKKILFTFRGSNLELLKKLQESLQNFNRFNISFLSNNEKISNLNLPELSEISEKKVEENEIDENEEKKVEENETINELEELPQLDEKGNDDEIELPKQEETKNSSNFDIDFKPKKASPGMTKIDLNQLSDDNTIENKDKLSTLLSKEGIEVDDWKIDDGVINLANDIKELNKHGFDDKDEYHKPEGEFNEVIHTDIKNTDGTDIKETLSKMESLEMAFKEINLNELNELAISVIKEYQKVLIKYNNEYSAQAREVANASSNSIIYGPTPSYFETKPQTESDKKLEDDYRKLIGELKEFSKVLQKMDLDNIQETDIECLKIFQAKLNVAYTFFDKETTKTM